MLRTITWWGRCRPCHSWNGSGRGSRCYALIVAGGVVGDLDDCGDFAMERPDLISAFDALAVEGLQMVGDGGGNRRMAKPR